jgi:hypothetical protein
LLRKDFGDWGRAGHRRATRGGHYQSGLEPAPDPVGRAKLSVRDDDGAVQVIAAGNIEKWARRAHRTGAGAGGTEKVSESVR